LRDLRSRICGGATSFTRIHSSVSASRSDVAVADGVSAGCQKKAGSRSRGWLRRRSRAGASTMDDALLARAIGASFAAQPVSGLWSGAGADRCRSRDMKNAQNARFFTIPQPTDRGEVARTALRL